MKDWKVLLIGGSSAVGKSYLARQLSNKLQIPLAEVDDIRVSLQQVVDKELHPDLYFFLTKPYSDILKEYSTDELVDRLLKVSKEVWPALSALITKHIAGDAPVIFEGDGIVPELLARRDQTEVKAIFIWDSKENLQANSLKRGWGDSTYNEFEEKQSNFSFGFGNELKRQAQEYNFAIVEATPLDTLLDRVREII